MVAMSFHFMDVGMGDSTFVIMGDAPATQQLALIDFGVHPLTKFKVGPENALIYLVRKIKEVSLARLLPVPVLDFLFLTHGDLDHNNMIKPLLEADYGGEYQGKKLEIRGLAYGGTKAEYHGLIDNTIAPQLSPGVKTDPLVSAGRPRIDNNGIVASDWDFQNKAILVYLLSVNFPTIKGASKNKKSLCLMFHKVASDEKVILMGDAEEDVENKIIEYCQTAGPNFLSAYALKLGHHGSKKAASVAWLQKVRPRAVFATGDFVWAHPYCETIERVIDQNILGEMKDHFICCGRRVGNDNTYFNHKTTGQIGLNLWYTSEPIESDEIKVEVDDEEGMNVENVEPVRGEWMFEEETRDEEFFAQGATFAVQWELKLVDGEAPALWRTDTYVPVDDRD
jgi:competence protein ComEC